MELLTGSLVQEFDGHVVGSWHLSPVRDRILFANCGGALFKVSVREKTLKPVIAFGISVG